MREVTLDDALIGLIHSMILQSVEDYRKLQSSGVIGLQGEIYGHKFRGRISKSAYHHIDGFRYESEAEELVDFIRGKSLDFLCDAIGHKACRIRKALGLSKEVLP
jgi:hypothetical protein